MSVFKLKPEKFKSDTEIKTLDETHKKIVNEFKKRKELLPRKKAKLTRLEKKLDLLNKKTGSEYTNDDIKLKSKIKSEIKELSEEIYDIENNVSEMEYYSKTNDLLMDYYDIIEDQEDYLYEEHPELSKKKEKEDDVENDALDRLNILNKKRNKGVRKVNKRRKKKVVPNNSNNILSYFNGQDSDVTEDNSDKDNNKDRAYLLDQYRMLIDNEYVSEKSRNIDPIRKCSNCDREKTLIQTEGLYVCIKCGEAEMIIIEAEKPNYKDSCVPEKPGYPYKRINHYNE